MSVYGPAVGSWPSPQEQPPIGANRETVIDDDEVSLAPRFSIGAVEHGGKFAIRVEPGGN